MVLPDAEYQPFLPSKTGNWFGYSMENPYIPPARKSYTVASCLDRHYWLRHPGGDFNPILALWNLDLTFLIPWDRHASNVAWIWWFNRLFSLIGLGQFEYYNDWQAAGTQAYPFGRYKHYDLFSQQLFYGIHQYSSDEIIESFLGPIPFAWFIEDFLYCHLPAWFGELNYEPFWPVFVYTVFPKWAPGLLWLWGAEIDPELGLKAF